MQFLRAYLPSLLAMVASSCRPALARLGVSIAAAAAGFPLQGREIAGVAAGVLEVGAPQFAIRGAETLGLASPPTDLHVMPDGRILIFAAQQIAIGDGVRWEAMINGKTDQSVTLAERPR